MPTREQIIEQFGGIENVPEYLRRGFEQQDQAQARREQEQRDHEAALEAERARIKALRKPPQNVRLVGRRVHFEPPETADQLEFAGFWVSEQRNGEWTKHGDYVLPDVRSAVLFGTGPCYVETWYHQMALGEMYRSEIVYAESPETGPAAGGATEETPPPAAGSDHAELIETVRDYLTATGRPPGYYERWRRVLAGLGAEEHDDPMTAAEAQSYVDRGWGHRWPPIVEALRSREQGEKQ